MERREHPRIHLPFEVEVEHPSLGTVRSIARDISESGMFVTATGVGVRVGSKVKVTAIGSALAEGSPTPTISMEVASNFPDCAERQTRKTPAKPR